MPSIIATNEAGSSAIRTSNSRRPLHPSPLRSNKPDSFPTRSGSNATPTRSTSTSIRSVSTPTRSTSTRSASASTPKSPIKSSRKEPARTPTEVKSLTQEIDRYLRKIKVAGYFPRHASDQDFKALKDFVPRPVESYGLTMLQLKGPAPEVNYKTKPGERTASVSKVERSASTPRAEKPVERASSVTRGGKPSEEWKRLASTKVYHFL